MLPLLLILLTSILSTLGLILALTLIAHLTLPPLLGILLACIAVVGAVRAIDKGIEFILEI